MKVNKFFDYGDNESLKCLFSFTRPKIDRINFYARPQLASLPIHDQIAISKKKEQKNYLIPQKNAPIFQISISTFFHLIFSALSLYPVEPFYKVLYNAILLFCVRTQCLQKKPIEKFYIKLQRKDQMVTNIRL